MVSVTLSSFVTVRTGVPAPTISPTSKFFAATTPELGELMVQDALHREESCGGHFREEYQTEEGEAKRNDELFSYVAAWEFQGPGKPAALHKEPLAFENVHLSTRSYK